MFLGACPLAFFYNLVATHQFGQLRSGQVGAFIKILILYVAIMWGWLSYNNIYTPLDALRQAVFTVVSLTSSTGYASSNYLNWGAFAATAALIFTLTGGCSGSTSGSVKIFRWQVVIAQLKRALITTTEPNRMLPLKVGKISVSSTAANSVVIFFMAYFFSIAVLTTLVSICGVDFLTAFSAVINCITNVGCTLAKDMSYADFSDTVKVILSFTMLLGRLSLALQKLLAKIKRSITIDLYFFTPILHRLWLYLSYLGYHSDNNKSSRVRLCDWHQPQLLALPTK